MIVARGAGRWAALGLAAFAGTAIADQSRPPVVPSVDTRVATLPVTFSQAGQRQLAYELHVTNVQTVDVDLVEVRLTTGSRPLATYRGQDLAARLVRPGLPNAHPTPQSIGPGLSAVVNVWTSLPDGVEAGSVTHALDLRVRRQPEQSVTISGTVEVSRREAVVLGPPLEGGPWVAIYDPLLKGGHRTALYAVDGRARIPGRFAIDWIRLPPDGRMPPAPTGGVDDRNGFGANVLAVADARVVAALDDTADHTPPPIPPALASGNYVALDLGSGRFAFYEHLQRGSLAVREGDRVQRGQVLARLGASGSSSIGPHLHFHVADARSLLGAEGLPFVFTRFERLGAFDSIGALLGGEAYVAAPHAAEADTRPSPNAVVRFP